MLEQEKIKEWYLEEWWDRIDKVEDEIIKIKNTKQEITNIDKILISNYGKLVLSIREILTLLKNGYPNGALSIARTVYESMILTKFIYQKYEEDNNTDLIERYFDDHNVKAYEPLIKLHEWLYVNNPDVVGIKDMLKYFRKEQGILKKKYGNITGQYWWINKKESDNISFKKIDKMVNDNIFLRILYERACIGIHASAMGSYALLAREKESGNKIYTDSIVSGFEVPLLLGMVSHDIFVKIICKHFEANSETILSNSSDLDVNALYDEYAIRILFDNSQE